MIVLGLDFETQCVDAKNTRITEVGAVLYRYHGKPPRLLVPKGTVISKDFAHEPAKITYEGKPPQVLPVWEKMETLSQFCYEPEYPPQSEKVVKLTGITDEMLKNEGIPRKQMIENHLRPMLAEADIVLVHNEGFDREVLESTARLLDVKLPEKEWLCTLRNFPWKEGLTCHKLGHLGWEHGLDFPAASLHRAYKDVELMMALVAQYDFDEVLAYAREPWVFLKADCLPPWQGRGGDGGVQVGIAKTLGFTYEKVYGSDLVNIPKTWVSRTKKKNLPTILDTVAKSSSPFRVVQIEGL